MEQPLRSLRAGYLSDKGLTYPTMTSQHDYAKVPRPSGDGMETKTVQDNDSIVSSSNNTFRNSREQSSVPTTNATKYPKEDVLCKAANFPTITDSGVTCPTLSTVFFDDAFAPEGSITEGKCLLLEREAECLDLNSLIKDLEERNRALTSENERLTSKLSGQSKVNSDLKKLLVASVGEDVGLRIEELVNEKAKFDTTVTTLETELEDISEEFNRMSIECDVWRTKFLASRMMSNGLTDVKTTLFTKHRNCQAALQKLLEEQSDIRQHLRATNRLLQVVYNATVAGSTERQNSCWEKAFQQISIIELSHVNNNFAEDICFSVNPTSYYETVNNNSSAEEEVIPLNYLTPAEKMACHVLKSDSESAANMDLVMQKMGRQYMGNGYTSRFLTNNFRLTFDCCDRCSGALQVV